MRFNLMVDEHRQNRQIPGENRLTESVIPLIYESPMIRPVAFGEAIGALNASLIIAGFSGGATIARWSS